MAHNRAWKILNWNVRRLNSDRKWNSIRDKVVESKSEIICLQETIKDSFDSDFIKKLYPLNFDSFEFLPSVSASGGILVA